MYASRNPEDQNYAWNVLFFQANGASPVADLAYSQSQLITLIVHLAPLLESIPNYLKEQRSAERMVKDCWRASICQSFDRLFALCFYGWVAKDCRVGLSGLQCPGYKMCVKEVVLACMCDLALGWWHQACGECMLDSEPSWGSLSFLCWSAAPCLDALPTLVPSAPPATLHRVAPGISAHVRANPEPSCCACTHQVLADNKN